MRVQGKWGWFSHDIRRRGFTAWVMAAVLLTFYIVLYFTEWLTPLAQTLKLSSKWDLYGLLYTVGILGGGVYMLRRYRHNPYQIIRTSVVMFVQVSFAFSVPLLLKFFEQPDYYFSYIWPLKIDYFFPSTIRHQPLPFVIYSFVAALVVVPVMTFFFGKRWYCSWVCGCGGLANTFGEPWRHLSDKSSKSWKLEKFTIHTVLILALLTTAIAFASVAAPDHHGLAKTGALFRKYYGLVVVAILAGVVGVGFYPLAGTRVWCRFACPMAALLGLMQKFGRFRIRVKKDMCISCGMCSSYCEMGIDVRSYAQANQSFTRASCVGCGMCAEVCPRGVLRLENVSRKDPQELSQAMVAESWKAEKGSIQARN